MEPPGLPSDTRKLWYGPLISQNIFSSSTPETGMAWLIKGLHNDITQDRCAAEQFIRENLVAGQESESLQ